MSELVSGWIGRWLGRLGTAIRLCIGRTRERLAPALFRLNEGQAVEYEVVENRGKSSAENLKVSR
jgi:hypothetical protein